MGQAALKLAIVIVPMVIGKVLDKILKPRPPTTWEKIVDAIIKLFVAVVTAAATAWAVDAVKKQYTNRRKEAGNENDSEEEV